MPRIIVQTHTIAGDHAATTLNERIAATNLESGHYRAQLMDRLSWATADAERLEGDRLGQLSGEPVEPAASQGPSRQPGRRRPGAARSLATSAIVAAALSLIAALPAQAARLDDDSSPASAIAPAGVALQWYDITRATVAAAAYAEPVSQSRAWSVSWLAAARATRHRHDAAYTTAAFAQALHDTLAAEVPSQQAQLDSDLAATLATIPDGRAKQAGTAAGEWQAAAALAERQNDGLDTASLDIPFTPPAPAPGVWQPTPPAYAPALRAGEGDARPFVLAANDQFDPGPPPSLNSRAYLKDLAEVRAYGSSTNSLRTPSQTDTALFWEPAANIQYVQVVRAVLADTDRPLAWQARFVAAFNAVTTDAQIAIYNAKFKYVFWRPVTAIRTGSVDPDPTWSPLFTTPRYPDWPSGHGGFAGAAQAVLTAFLGPEAPAPISVTSPTDPGSTHTYQTWHQITREVIDARVWEGIHFRFSDITGARVGSEVAHYDLRHLRSIGL